MDDKTLLQAMRQMMKDELAPIRQKIERLENKVDEMAEELHEVRGAQNVIAGWVESLQTDVKSLNDLHSA